MDEMFRKRGIWIGLGALALVFLCLLLVGLATMAVFAPRLGPAYGVVPQVQAPAPGDGGAVPAPAYGYTPAGWYAGWGPFGIFGFGIGLIVRFLVFGLLLVLFFRLVRRIFWGPRHWGYRHWGPDWHCTPSEGHEGQQAPGAGPGPWAGHHHRHWGPPPWWGQEPEKTRGEDKPEPAESGYTGPQE